MGLSRARGVALPLLVIAVLAAGLLVPATAAPSAAAPSVSWRTASGSSVAVSGRTVTVAPRVRFDRRTSSGWVLVKRVRAHHHRYATTLSVRAGATVTFRVTSNHRSRRFVVQMPAAKTTSTAVLYDACGARPRKADGSAWSCTFHDDFAGTTLDRTKWVPQTVFATGDQTVGFACYADDPANVSVGSGVLSLTVRKLAAPQPCGSANSSLSSSYTAGSISTYHLFSQQYGRFEARMRNTATTARGLHEAFWLWPDDRVPSTTTWPDAGEIDISETYSQYPNLSVPFLHYSADAGGPQPGINTAWNCTALRGRWNTYTLEWTPTRVSILVNGKTCLTNTSGDPAFQKPYIVALTAALGSGSNAMTADTPIPARVDIDYVRVWH